MGRGNTPAQAPANATGEVLADRLVVSPFVRMWAANAFVLMVSPLAV